MAELPTVEINRTCLSLLFRDNALSPGDQEGFLIGEVIERALSLSDTQENVGTATVIKITSTFPIPKHCRFYNGVGKIDHAALEDLLGPFSDKIVGYFEFKRNLNEEIEEIITFTQRNVFMQLGQRAGHSHEKPFVFMVLRQRHESRGVIQNSFGYFTFRDGSLIKLASSIPNLGDTSHDRYVQNAPVPLVDNLFAKMTAPKKDPASLPVVKIHLAMLEQLKIAANNAVVLEEEYKIAKYLLDKCEADLADRRKAKKLQTAIKRHKVDDQVVPSTSKTNCMSSEPPAAGSSKSELKVKNST
ncbi:BRISC complex subunit FAM175B-like [Neocloeon triangulifer]|uniref:BRISC complex subunit FAM175B-like n=1 Tax=Neocloeon triangulifer TaxID=2078957 RepID=UPI00286F0355|nr:BRISC complex subunit FAM175B-like [Neocloeon triangulifer]